MSFDYGELFFWEQKIQFRSDLFSKWPIFEIDLNLPIFDVNNFQSVPFVDPFDVTDMTYFQMTYSAKWPVFEMIAFGVAHFAKWPFQMTLFPTYRKTAQQGLTC